MIIEIKVIIKSTQVWLQLCEQLSQYGYATVRRQVHHIMCNITVSTLTPDGWMHHFAWKERGGVVCDNVTNLTV